MGGVDASFLIGWASWCADVSPRLQHVVDMRTPPETRIRRRARADRGIPQIGCATSVMFNLRSLGRVLIACRRIAMVGSGRGLFRVFLLVIGSSRV